MCGGAMGLACQPGEFCLVADETLTDGFGRCVREERSRGEKDAGMAICGGPANIACRPDQLCLWDTEIDDEWGRCYNIVGGPMRQNGAAAGEGGFYIPALSRYLPNDTHF